MSTINNEPDNSFGRPHSNRASRSLANKSIPSNDLEIALILPKNAIPLPYPLTAFRGHSLPRNLISLTKLMKAILKNLFNDIINDYVESTNSSDRPHGEILIIEFSALWLYFGIIPLYAQAIVCSIFLHHRNFHDNKVITKHHGNGILGSSFERAFHGMRIYLIWSFEDVERLCWRNYSFNSKTV